MSRLTDLETAMRESYALVRDYERILQVSPDPKEKVRCRREIAEQWTLIEQYWREYSSLAGRPLPQDIIEIAGRFAEIDNQIQSIPSSPQPSAQTIDSAALRAKLQRLDDVELETLVLDHFPAVMDKFSRGLRHDEKLNLLLDYIRRRPEEASLLATLLGPLF